MRVLRVFGTMGVWDPPFGAGRLGSWVSGTSCLGPWVRDQLFGTTVFGIWGRVLGTSWLGQPFGTMGVGCLGPIVWDHESFGPAVWDCVWDHRCFGPWVFGVWGHGCLGPTWTTVLGLWVFGTMGVWDHCLGMGVLDHRCLKPAAWALKKCAQISTLH